MYTKINKDFESGHAFRLIKKDFDSPIPTRASIEDIVNIFFALNNDNYDFSGIDAVVQNKDTKQIYSLESFFEACRNKKITVKQGSTDDYSGIVNFILINEQLAKAC